MTMRDVSIEAEEWCNAMGITSDREVLMLVTLAKLRRPSNRSQLAIAADIRINCVCRPIKNLVESGILKELEPVVDPRSGRRAHPLWFNRQDDTDARQLSLV